MQDNPGSFPPIFPFVKFYAKIVTTNLHFPLYDRIHPLLHKLHLQLQVIQDIQYSNNTKSSD